VKRGHHVAIPILALVAAVTLGVSSSQGVDPPPPWQMYGHDAMHTGRSPADGPKKLVPLWSLPLGTIETNNSPVVGPDGSIYVTTRFKFFAVNPNGTERCHASLFASAAAPALSADGSAVYVPDKDGLHKLNASTCATIWDFAARISYSSPTISSDGTIYFGSAPTVGNSHLYALNPDKTFKFDWDSGSGSGIESSPALGPNGEVYFLHNGLHIVALKADGTGTLWTRSTPAGIGEAFNSPSVGPDGTVYIGSSDHKFYALDPANGNTKPGWPTPVTNFMYQAAASISQDGSRIYRGDNGGILYAFSSSGGSPWQYPSGGGAIFDEPALSANGIVYFTRQGTGDNLYALRASDGGLVDSYAIGSSDSSPALSADGILYVLGNDADAKAVLYAFAPNVVVRKALLPPADPGRFDLMAAGSVVEASAGDGAFGAKQVLPGTRTIGEVAAAGTNLSNYTTSIACTRNGAPGPSGKSTSLNVSIGPADMLDCTITNRRKATVTVTKSLLPGADAGRFDLRVAGAVVKASAANGDSGSAQVAPGVVRVTETAAAGTNLSDYTTSIACTRNGGPGPSANGIKVDVNLGPADVLACTITNKRKGTVSVTKSLLPGADAGVFDLKVDGTVVKASAGNGDSGSLQVPAGTHKVLEVGAGGTSLANYASSIACTVNGSPGPSGNSSSLTVTVGPADAVACTITNKRKATVSVTKSLVPTNDPGRFDLKVAGMVVKANAGNGDAGSTKMAPGTFRVAETAAVGTSLTNYTTSIACTLNGGPGPSANNTTKLDVTVAPADVLACTITNTRKP
jgi:outer membrane protein assembly factor BamB